MLSFQQILYVIIGISVFATLLAPREVQLKRGFSIAVILLAVGYRRAFLSKYLEFHPSEILFWLLFFLLLLRREARSAKPQNKTETFRLPNWLIFFMLFWLWGLAASLFSGLSWDLILNQFKPFPIFPVVLWLSWSLLKQSDGLNVFLRAMFASGTIVGVFGALEYYFPGVFNSIPGFSASPFTRADYMGFVRAKFSFYGAPTATFMLVIIIPLGLALWSSAKTTAQKLMLLGAIGFQTLGVYIGGYRSMWLALGTEIILFVMLYRGVFVGILGLIPLILLYRLLPSEALMRFSTLFAASQGRAVDSSIINRIQRVDEAFDILSKNPLGLGWGASGWVHNDVLQIAVDLGVAAVLIFVIAYLVLAFRLARKTLSLRGKKGGAEFQISFGIFLGFVGSGFLYASQGVTWQVFLALPAWLIWALAAHWSAEPPVIPSQESVHASENIRTAPRFQQRRFSPPHARIR